MAKAIAGPQTNRPRPQMDSTQRTAMMGRQALQRKYNEFYTKEKPALVLSMNASGNDGTIFVSGGGAYIKDAEEGPAMLMLSSDDYLRLQRLVDAGIRVELEADVKTKFFNDD
ncbi:MAG: hypothetical protein H7Y01_00025, partial [Ferruginibacter sp.]|nr:hypothetical protein [Chitinophagaceae bacterium]